MKLLGSSEDNAGVGSRPQIRTQDDAAAVGYGFHPQENHEFPPFVPKRWPGPGTDDAAIVDVRIRFYFSLFYSAG